MCLSLSRADEVGAIVSAESSWYSLTLFSLCVCLNCGVVRLSLLESTALLHYFMQAHIADAMDSADNPLGGRRWWLEAESPWQVILLATRVGKDFRI